MLDELSTKIENIEYAIDQIDAAINNIKEYKEYEDICNDLECEKSALEYDLETLNVQYEELYETLILENKQEQTEREREFWREVI